MSTTSVAPAVHPFLLSNEKNTIFSISALTTVAAFAARKFRVKPSIVALLALFTLTAFCSLHQHLNEAPRLTLPASTRPPSFASNKNLRYRTHSTARPMQPKIVLGPDEELGSVIAFMAALRSNSLPDSVNPLASIDPELVLDFDTRKSNADKEVRHLVEDTWSRLPVVLLSKRYSPIAREIKGFLDEYNLQPPPAVFDVDERADEAVLTPLLYRLTGAVDLPILLVAGKAVGSIETIRDLAATGELRAMIAAGGAVVDGRKKKAGKRRLPS